MTAEQLEAARAERMRQNGHGAITTEDVRTWIEETGLCVFLPRSAQAGMQAALQNGLYSSTATPTFVEAVAGERLNEPSAELIASAESLLVRLEAEGVAVRLNLSGQPHNPSGDQPDYVVAGWVLPYIYALRGDRDWRRSPQLTGSRQVSQLAVMAAKQLDSANLNAAQIRDALGREVTEVAVLRALHELWKQLRIIPVVPEVGSPALWQPLRQRFQKAIAEGASTSQVTAISVLASIYLQAVIAASMEDVEHFLSPLTARSKIREVVRGLAATRQVHSTTLGHSPMFYVAGTLPDFPAVVPALQISSSYSSYRGNGYRGGANSVGRGSSYLSSYLGHSQDDDFEPPASDNGGLHQFAPPPVTLAASAAPSQPVESVPVAATVPVVRPAPVASKAPSSGKPSQPRPRSVGPVHPRDPRERSRSGAAEQRAASPTDRRRAPAPRAASNGNGSRSAGNGVRKTAEASNGRNTSGNSGKAATNGAQNGSHTNGNGHASNGNGSHDSVKNGATKNGSAKNGASSHSPARSPARSTARPASGTRSASKTGSKTGSITGSMTGSKTSPRASSAARSTESGTNGNRKPAASAAKRYSFSGQAKQAPKAAAKAAGKLGSSGAKRSSRPAASARPSNNKRRG